MGDQRGVGLAHVAIAKHVGQRWQRRQQLPGVAGQRGAVFQRLGGRGDGQVEVGQQRLVDQPRQLREAGRLGATRLCPGRGRLLDGLTPQAGLDQAQREFGLPLQRPDLVEGAACRSADPGNGAPGDVENRQAMQHVAAGQVVVVA